MAYLRVWCLIKGPVLQVANSSLSYRKMVLDTSLLHLITLRRSMGLVERAVQTFMPGVKKQGNSTIEIKLARFLLSYRFTPQTTTDKSPSQLRWGRSLRSHLDLLRPDVGAKVHVAQPRQKRQHNQHSRMRQVEVGNAVNGRNYSRGLKWITGTVIQEIDPLSARVELENDTVVRRHYYQLVTRPTEASTSEAPVPFTSPRGEEARDPGFLAPDVNSPELTMKTMNNQLDKGFNILDRPPLLDATQQGMVAPTTLLLTV